MAALLAGLLVAAAALGWRARERATQNAALAAKREAQAGFIDQALQDSAAWQEKGRLPEALSAARRADAVLAGGDVDLAITQRVQARLADLVLLDRLENVPLEKETDVHDDHYDWSGTDALYRQTFRDAGMDIEGTPTALVAERLRSSTVAVELAAVLDHWAVTRRKLGANDGSGWRRLLDAARAADRDPFRHALAADPGKREHGRAT